MNEDVIPYNENKSIVIGNLHQIHSKTIVIFNASGQKYWLDMVDGKLETGGELPMTEAAKIFFDEVKRIAEQTR